MKASALSLIALAPALVGFSSPPQTACPPSWLPTFGASAPAGFEATVRALEIHDDGGGGGPALYAAGLFTSAGGVAANRIAKWDGAGWSPVGSGMDDRVIALTVFDDGNGGGPALYAGGHFTTAGGVAAQRIAKWDGTSWSPVGSGMDDWVNVLTVFDDGGGPALYAGGNFTTAGGVAANFIARWDGSSWSALGSGMDNRVYAFAGFDHGSGGGPDLYAGGLFTIAGGVTANFIARWNGSSWSALGSGMNSRVYFLTVFDDGSGGGPALHAGGNYTTAGAALVNRVSKWDGSAWSALSGGMNDTVFDLTVFDDGTGGGPALYAGGKFTSAGGVAASRVARWDGTSWSALGSGVSDTVSAFTVFDDGAGGGPALHLGGDFAIAGGAPAFRIAKWGRPPPTPVARFCAAKTTLVCGAALIRAYGISSATATSGFVIEAGPVRGCRAGLLLYSNQPIQPGANFGGPGNGLLCLEGTGLRRAGPIESGGTSAQACDGTLSIDMNLFHAFNWTASGCFPPPGQNNPAGFLSNMGTTINAQMWGRDSIATGQVLSDGMRWSIGP